MDHQDYQEAEEMMGLLDQLESEVSLENRVNLEKLVLQEIQVERVSPEHQDRREQQEIQVLLEKLEHQGPLDVPDLLERKENLACLENRDQ